MIANENRSISYSFGGAGPSIRLSADLRRQAGFDPALVVEIHIPPNPQEVIFADTPRITRAGCAMNVRPEKAYVVTLAASRHTNEIALETLRFGSLVSDASTLYKLFYRLNPAETCVLHLPDILWGTERLTFQSISLETAERTQPVRLCEARK